MWVLNVLKKLIFHLYYSVFLKYKKIAYFALFLTKKTCLTAYFWTIWTDKMSKKHKSGLLYQKLTRLHCEDNFVFVLKKC